MIDARCGRLGRWEAWVMRAAEPRGLPFQATLRLLLAQRLGLTVRLSIRAAQSSTTKSD